MGNTQYKKFEGTISEFAPDCDYLYRTMSVSHFKDMQSDIDTLKRAGVLSNQDIFQGILEGMKFEIPNDFPEARSVIIMASRSKPMHVNFHLNGLDHEVILPHQYYDDGLSIEMYKNEITQNILQETGHRLEQCDNLHLKLLAVRSGLGKYGRNNIFYAERLGCFLALHAFLTDQDFAEDNWHDLSMLELCDHCRVCRDKCPTGAICEDRFVVDIGKCITLYNENEGTLPDWIPGNAHNALFGCMRCQSTCPANREALGYFGRFEDVTEEETRQLLLGDPSEIVLKSIGDKLKLNHLVKTKAGYDLLQRNLSVLLPKVDQSHEQ